MKRRRITLLGSLLCLSLLLTHTFSFGQNSGKDKKSSSFERYWYMSLNGGIAQLWGDVSEPTFMKQFTGKPGFGGAFNLGYQFHSVFGVRGDFSYQELYSAVNLPTGKETMRTFHHFDHSLQLTMSLLNIFKVNEDRLLDIYGFVGIGLANWKSERFNAETGAIIERNGGAPATKGLFGCTTEVFGPFGFGVSCRLSDRFAIGVEHVWKKVNSDFVDAKVSGKADDYYSNTNAKLTWQLRGGDNVKGMAKKFDKVVIAAVPEVLERHGNTVKMTVKGNIPEKFMGKKAVMKVVPKLYYAGKTKELKPIFIRGEKVNGAGKQIEYKTGGTFSQDYTVTWENGMEDAQLVTETLVYIPKDMIANEGHGNDYIVENIKNHKELAVREIAMGTVVTGQRISFNPKVSAGNPYSLHGSPEFGMLNDHGYKGQKSEQKEAVVYFKVNLADLNWKLPLNIEKESREVYKELKEFVARGWEIKDVEINAWASPEGDEAFNAKLSERRATAGNKVLRQLCKELKLDVNSLQVNMQARGEDWIGFTNAVRKSNIADKNLILNVINSQNDLAEREKEIRKLSLVYESVEKEILPELRRVEVKFTTLKPEKSAAEFVNAAKNDVASLDEDEALYAAFLENDLNQKILIYNNIIGQYPKSVDAYNNLAYIYMVIGNNQKAKENLHKAHAINPNQGGVLNNLGVISGMENDFAKAETYFNSARQNGVDVSYSLGVLNITKGNYPQSLSMMKNRACDYNIALAHVASGQLEQAEKMIKCVPQSPEKDYLAAVLYAKKDNKEECFKYLVNAIKGDASYKGIAKNDKEFVKFNTMPEFQALIR